MTEAPKTQQNLQTYQFNMCTFIVASFARVEQ